MAELETIADALRRQRRDMEDLIESASSRSGETAELVNRIEDLRQRSEETLRRFQESVASTTAKDRR